MIVVLAGLIPAILLIGFIWYKDPQKEPFGQLLKAIGLGVLICLPVAIFEYIISDILFGSEEYEPTGLISTVLDALCVAAIPEETFKLLALWLCVRKNKYFDEPVDGIVYAVCVGMGFAALENVLYLFDNNEDWQTVAFMRALLSVPGHYAFAVLMGYYYSQYYFVKRSASNAVNILLMPVLAHTFYNSLAGVGSSVVTMIILVYFCYRLHKNCYKKLKKKIYENNMFNDFDDIESWRSSE